MRCRYVTATRNGPFAAYSRSVTVGNKLTSRKKDNVFSLHYLALSGVIQPDIPKKIIHSI
jgi:hypothetical protein